MADVDLDGLLDALAERVAAKLADRWPAAPPRPPIDEEPLMDGRAVAKRTRIAVETLEAMRARGDGPPFIKIGRLVRYKPAAVEAWLAEKTRASGSDARARK